MAEKEAPKEKDIGQIVRYLGGTFNQLMSKLERATRNHKTGEMNDAYVLTREFAYLLNEVVQGPRCMLQKHITDCNNFLDSLMQEMNTLSPEKAKR